MIKSAAPIGAALICYAKALKQTRMQAEGITAKERIGYLRADFNAGLLTQEEFDNELEEIMAEDDWEIVSEVGEKDEQNYRDNGKVQKNTVEDGGVKFSITEQFTDKDGNTYDSAVLLDTDIFDGFSPRNWGDVLKEYLEKRIDESPFIMPVIDENGNTTLLQFANHKDRVTKDGASNHNVLDKLVSTSDNISKLAVVHIDEIVSVSEENSPYYTNEHNHQWLDENGWLHRNANVINKKNGNIYNVTVDIAKAADGRTILYATDGKIKKVGNVQVNSLKIKGSGQNSDSGDNVAQDKENVNRQYSYSPNDDAYWQTGNRERLEEEGRKFQSETE